MDAQRVVCTGVVMTGWMLMAILVMLIAIVSVAEFRFLPPGKRNEHMDSGSNLYTGLFASVVFVFARACDFETDNVIGAVTSKDR